MVWTVFKAGLKLVVCQGPVGWGAARYYQTMAVPNLRSTLIYINFEFGISTLSVRYFATSRWTDQPRSQCIGIFLINSGEWLHTWLRSTVYTYIDQPPGGSAFSFDCQPGLLWCIGESTMRRLLTPAVALIRYSSNLARNKFIWPTGPSLGFLGGINFHLRFD